MDEEKIPCPFSIDNYGQPTCTKCEECKDLACEFNPNFSVEEFEKEEEKMAVKYSFNKIEIRRKNDD